MVTRGTLVFLAACCILVSVPVSYLVNIYRMANLIPPYDALTGLIKFLPFILLSIVLVYGAAAVAKLANVNRVKEAAKLSLILIVLLAVAFAVWLLTFNLGVRYIA
jgi:hypothetical protein